MGINTKGRILFLTGFKSIEDIASIENLGINTV